MANDKIVRSASAMIIIALLVLLVFCAHAILFPLIMALLFAILLRPIVKFLNAKLHFPHLLAVITSIVLAIGVLGLVVVIMGSQIASFFSDLPAIKENLGIQLANIQKWISAKSGVSISEQEDYFMSALSNMSFFSSDSVTSITNGFMNLILIPIYTFLILIYRPLLIEFLLKLVKPSEISSLKTILNEIQSVMRNYISGLMIEVVIVATLTGTGLWIIGVKYFVFLGILTALLNLIPYIGILVAAVISSFIAMMGTTDVTVVFGVVIVNVIVQLIDNNILIPKVVGSKVRINALSSMVGVIIGGTLAGVAGMFLAIPIIAMLKVIFDHIPALESYGYVLGDEIPKGIKLRLSRRKAENDTSDSTEKTED